MKSNYEYWNNQVANILPSSFQQWFQAEKHYLHKHIKKNSHVLDVGCGTGRSIMNIIKMTKNIIGIDHDEKAIAGAEKNFAAYPEVKFLVAEAENLPFPDQSFDHVTCIGAFTNFGPKKHIILEEMRRVLKDKGTIIISVYAENALTARLKAYKALGLKVVAISGATCIFDQKIKDNISEQFSRADLSTIFNQARLNIKHITKASIGYLCQLNKMEIKNVNHIPV